MVPFFGITSWGATLRKLAIFNEGKYVHIVPSLKVLFGKKRISHAWLEKMYQGTRQGYLNENRSFVSSDGEVGFVHRIR